MALDPGESDGVTGAGPARALVGLLATAAALAGCTNHCPEVEIPGHVQMDWEGRGAPSAFVAVGDCSGDGRPDVINGRRVFVARADGGFDLRELEAPIPSTTSAGTFVDLDADGEGDLVVAGPGVQWHRGLGGCRFGPGVAIAPATRGQPSQVLAADVDLDGLTDLAISYTARRESPAVLLTAWGDGRFVDRTPAFAPRDDLYMGYGTFFDDVDGDGHREMFVVADFDQGSLNWGRPSDEPSFERDANVSSDFSDAHPMGLCPLDFDRDGRIDYFLSGITDANLLLHGSGSRSLESVADGALLSSPDGAYAWGCAAQDADLDGWSDLLVLSLTQDNGGAAPATLYVNQRDGTFGCAAPGVLDATVQFHGLACGDFSLDGRPDCVATSGDVSRGLGVLHNRLEARGNWVGLRLRGTVSSAEASGARVSLDGARPPLVVMAGGQSSMGGEHDRGVVLAIGQQGRADVTVEWPSGLRQTVSAEAGRYTTVTEPSAVEVARRVVTADGVSEVEVVVDPTAAGARTATLDCSGTCAWAGPSVVEPSGRTRRSLVAPTFPGSARVLVSLDGTPLRVRPRVRFVAP